MNPVDTLSRARILLGTASMDRLREARVIVFGVGGVGSWCVESLVRSGLRHITIVDDDRVCPSNVNRQLMATTATIGQVKVEAMRNHLLTVNPDAIIDARHERFTAGTAAGFDLDSYDYVVDAIDSVADKALLIELATRSRAKLFSSMGAARKLDPTRVQVAEFFKVSGCPLARALRQRFKKSGRRPARKSNVCTATSSCPTWAKTRTPNAPTARSCTSRPYSASPSRASSSKTSRKKLNSNKPSGSAIKRRAALSTDRRVVLYHL